MRAERHTILITQLFLLLLFSTSATLLAAGPSIQFEANRGQTDARVRYLARSTQGTVFFTDNQIVFSRGQAAPVSFELWGGNTAVEWEASEPTAGETSYRVGRDPLRWADHVKQYARLVRHNVYQGIDAAWHGMDRRIEYDFMLAAGADPGRIHIRIKGARRVYLDHDGELVVSSDGREIRQHKPAIYQTAQDDSRLVVAGGFRLLSRNEVGFFVDRYDHSKPLIIDPVIDFSTYLGGDGEDQIIYSAGGVTAGNTTSVDFPGAAPARRQGSKIFYSSGGFTRIFGGSGDDRLTAVVVPFPINAPVVLGYTNSTDLPTSSAPGTQSIQPNYAGGASDGFFAYVTQLSPGVPGMVISYYGTNGEDRITGAITVGSACVFTGWTTARGFPIGSATTSSTQPALVEDGPGGGVDGFLAVASLIGSSVSTVLSLGSVRYFGGSGDDRPSSIARSSGYYIAGETSSVDFPNLSGISNPRKGDSDAFVIHYDTAFTNPSSVLFGGSGSDRAVGIAILQNGLAIGVAGTTSSADLPLVNPHQPAFGGGASDVFVATFASDLSQIRYATYWGGSSAEEVTVLSGDGANGWFIGGWTSSPDFPVSNAVQAQYGGGPDDGFLLHYDANGNIHQSTFFGGSGSDRILSLTSAGPFQASLGGRTTSPDLPLRNPQQDTLRGPSDGFIVLISTKFIGASHVTGSKGLRASADLALPAATPPVIYTLGSSDPASVLLADTRNGAALPSISITSSGSTTYYVDCQADGAAADITMTAPGFPRSTAHVDCVLPSITVAVFLGSVTGANGTYRMSAWADPARLFASLYAINPNNPNDGNALFARSDSDRIAVQVQVTEPAVLKASLSTILLDAPFDPLSQEGALTVTPLSVGTADLVFSSADQRVRSPAPLHFVVTVPFTANVPVPISGGFQTLYSLGLTGQIPPATSVAFSSSDSSRLLISTDPREVGAPSATLQLNSASPFPRIYLQALTSSGEVPLTISITGFDSITVPVRFKDPVLTASSPLLSSSTLAPGATTTISSSFESFTPTPQSQSVRLSLEISDTTVLRVTPAFVDLSTTSPFASFQVQGLAPGTATLTLRSSNGVVAPPQVNPLRVTVAQRPLLLRGVEVGKNLAAQMALTLPPGVAPNTTINISSSDPGRALISSSPNTAGQPQISMAASGQTVLFYVAGLTDSGEAKITAVVPGVGSVTATATLVPSGIGWTNDFLSSDLYSVSAATFVSAYALDPATLLPIAAQNVRQGITVAVQIQSDRPDIAVPVNPSVVLTVSTPVIMRNIAPGDATLTVIQPPGFSSPASRQRLTWRVAKAPLRLNVPGPLGINTQQQIAFYEVPVVARGKATTISSSDPAKMVVSAAANVLGSATIIVAAGTPFFVQGLDSRGTVYLSASLDGFAETAVPIQLTGAGILLTAQQQQSPLDAGGSILKDDGAYTTMFSGTTPINLNVAVLDADTGSNPMLPTILSLRPGIDPSIVVQSTNPAVGTIQRSPVRLDQTASSIISVDFQPVGLGDTEVVALPPPGFTIPAGRLAIQNGRIQFHVTLPGWDIGPQPPLEKGTARLVRLDLAANVKTFATSLPITIQSSDPSRLLVSRDAATAGSVSISMTLAAGIRSAGAFYIQALDREGSVRLAITAPGFADTYFDIPLADTTKPTVQ